MQKDRKSRIQDLSQLRADFAYKEVLRVMDDLDDKASEFKSHVKNVPIMIRTSGLAATYAFVFSKAKTERTKTRDGKTEEIKNSYRFIEEVTENWLIERGLLIKDENKKERENLGKTLASLNREKYRQVMRELLSFFTWLKRFADGLIEKSES